MSSAPPERAAPAPRTAAVRRWARRVAPALVGAVVFAATAALLDPALRVERPGALEAGDDAAVRETLGQYQRIYEDFFASGGGPAMLDAFPATKELKHFVFRDVGFLRDAGMVQVQDLAATTVVAVRRRSAGVVEADVYEEWNQMLQTVGDRKPVTAPKGFGQGFRYTLRRDGSGWRVVGWDLADLPAPERDGRRLW
ncbi:hypothetical protein [Anaeromyxobacter oryzisoli]|uniref:hypothetical protein n=1 Tax=Anaeromyxobacter oryzisoli TaxID=2925408 RepID=UPI001F56AAA2|nr:hypothetical protein [Anaeromyxobacter sp. SG63]